jgi:hypothetical protein
MNGKLHIEPRHPGEYSGDDTPTASVEPSSQLTPLHSVRPYFYRVPERTPSPSGETPPDQRRSTDDNPTGPRSR